MWKLIAQKISPWLEAADEARRLLGNELVKKLEAAVFAVSLVDKQNEQLGKKLATATARADTLQEEVFLLRDELAAVAKFIGIEVDTNCIDGFPKVYFSEEKTKEFSTIVDSVAVKQSEAYVESFANALIRALALLNKRQDAAKILGAINQTKQENYNE